VTRLSQHFLSDVNLLNKIAAALEPAPTDVVLEVGPGRGSLTRVLAPLVARVVGVETDRELARSLSAQVPANVTVVSGDALELDWHALLDGAFPFKVIGNIPYAITSPLIAKALEAPRPASIVYLVQREVASRLVARPGTRAYGALSVGVQALCTVDVVLRIPAGAFRPRPRVDSALVRLVPRTDPVVMPEEERPFRTFVTACFSRRRKQIVNALEAATEAPRAALLNVLDGLGVAPTIRPEALAPEVFARILRHTRSL